MTVVADGVEKLSSTASGTAVNASVEYTRASSGTSINHPRIHEGAQAGVCFMGNRVSFSPRLGETANLAGTAIDGSVASHLSVIGTRAGISSRLSDTGVEKPICVE